MPSPPPRVIGDHPDARPADLLAAATAACSKRTSYPDVELIVVDNGSIAADALALLARLAHTPRVRVIHDPRAVQLRASQQHRRAANASGEVLCFLNDDTRVIAPDWLDEMTRARAQPDVGVVGARLLYATARSSTPGVVLGAFALTHHLLQGGPPIFAATTIAAC